MLGSMLEQHMGLPLHHMQQAVHASKSGHLVRIVTAKQPKLSFYLKESLSTSKKRLETGDGQNVKSLFACC